MKPNILPPTIFCISLIVMWALHQFVPIKVLIARPWNLMGIIFVLDGLSVIIWAVVLFRRNQTVTKPFEEPLTLVTEGPYQVTRNPMYLGMVVMLIGIVIIFGSISPIFVPIIFVKIISDVYIAVEESNMERAFGEAYLQYKEQTPRWL